MTDDSPSASDRLDALARRATRSVMNLVSRGNRLAFGMLVIALVLCGGGFLLGLAALSGGIESVWIMIGGFFAVVGIGAPVLTLVRLWTVRRREDELTGELRSLMSADPASEQTIIETVEVSDAAQDQGVVVLSRDFYTMRDNLGPRMQRYPALDASLSALKGLGFVMISALVSFVFAGLSLIFLLALAL
jgi:membrane protein implicated in regulation of membrane protease activity